MAVVLWCESRAPGNSSCGNRQEKRPLFLITDKWRLFGRKSLKSQWTCLGQLAVIVSLFCFWSELLRQGISANTLHWINTGARIVCVFYRHRYLHQNCTATNETGKQSKYRIRRNYRTVRLRNYGPKKRRNYRTPPSTMTYRYLGNTTQNYWEH